MISSLVKVCKQSRVRQFVRFAQENLTLVKTKNSGGKQPEETGFQKVKAVKQESAEENVCREISNVNLRAESDFKTKVEIRTIETEDERPKMLTSTVGNELNQEDSYESRSEATKLMKKFFHKNLDDPDCQAFLTTSGEVICHNLLY